MVSKTFDDNMTASLVYCTFDTLTNTITSRELYIR